MDDAKLAYTVAEAAKKCSVSADTVYRWHHAGHLTLRKAGSRTIVLADDLDRLLHQAPALPRQAANAA